MTVSSPYRIPHEKIGSSLVDFKKPTVMKTKRKTRIIHFKNPTFVSYVRSK